MKAIILAITNPVTEGVDQVVQDSGGDNGGISGMFQVLANTIIGFIGILAVVMIIIGAVSLSTSQGDTSKVKKAKDTIMYGIIGMVVAILAFAIVNFAISSIS